ncbi:MAG: TonB-dependent receptor [Halioglobus sp.]
MTISQGHPSLRDGFALSMLILATAAQASDTLLEEVIVTAQKRAENVQDIPVTINVVTGELLDSFSLRNSNDLGDAVPGLTIQATPQNLAQVTLRGLGTGSGGESVDQSVGLFIDGIWAGRIREFQASLFDVERIEVIKGTQTALLGKNTSLGAISIISRRPGETNEGYLQAEYEVEFDSLYAAGAANLATEIGQYRLAFNYVDEGGYVNNQSTGNEVPQREQLTFRLSGNWAVGDNGNLLASYQYDDLDIFGDTFQPDQDTAGLMLALDPGADIGIDTTKTARTSVGDSGDAEDEQESQRAVVQYDHQINEHTLTALSGWSEYENERFTDSDFLSIDYLNTVFGSDYEQFSQELRLTSPGNQRFDYVAGMLYLNSEMDFTGITDASFPPPFLLAGLPLDNSSQRFYTQDTQVWSIFGQGKLALNERWRITLGLRYTDEEKDATFERQRLRTGIPGSSIIADILAPVVPPTDMTRSEDNLDGSINLQHDLTADTLVYASWARGSKSGGFTTEVALVEDAEYDTEEADTTELGFKMNLAEGAGYLNAALYFTEIENFQIITFTGTAFQTDTVPAETYGAEFETRWVLAPGLLAGASATYTEAEDKESGLRLPYAPKWSASVDLGYEVPLADTGLTFNVLGVLNYRDEQYMQRDERSPDGEYTLLNLRLGITSEQQNWEVALVGRNLLDQATSFGFDYPGFGGLEVPAGSTTLGSLNRPRTLSLQARFNF